MNELKTGSEKQPSSAAASGHIARRRLLRAGMAAAPVILTLSGRSAMAQGTCAKGLSPMAWNSLAPDGTNCKLSSHTVQSSTLGVSPGNWKPNGNGKLTLPWPVSCLPYGGYPTDPIPSKQDDARWATGTKFKDIFTGIPGYSESVSGLRDKSVSRILIDNNDTIERHLCAAYLNAATVAGYAMTLEEVQEAFGGKVGTMTLSESDMRKFLGQTWA